MLRLQNVKKDYGEKEQLVHVLKGISIQFRPSEFVSILGHSGCGKTTLLNLIGGLDKCSDGAVYLDGKSTKDYTDSDWNNYRNKQIGFVFQSYNLIYHMTVQKNVELPMVLADVPKEERKRRARAALERVGLLEHARKHPTQLSGGQMQRVAIARALVNNPSIILADEPTGALDSESGLQVMEILKEVANDKLVIMVTHNDVLAEEYSTRIIRMADGMIMGDTNEYTLEECLKLEKETQDILEQEYLQNENEFLSNVQASRPDIANDKNEKRKEKRKNFLKAIFKRRHKRKQKEKQRKTSMSFGTAVKLSLSNLNSKRGRSLLTSIAGSIGIIGIMIVLALSSGATSYIRGIEENALSQYPITIEKMSMDVNSVLGILSGRGDTRPENPDPNTIYTNNVLGNLLGNINNVMAENDLEAFKEYLENNSIDDYGYVKYDYGVEFQVYSLIEDKNGNKNKYTRISPFLDLIDETLNSSGLGSFLSGYTDMITEFCEMMEVWDEMVSNEDLLKSQYELVGSNSKWPTRYDEIVIVVDSNNQLNDYSLFAMGLLSPDKVVNAIDPSQLFGNGNKNNGTDIGEGDIENTASDLFANNTMFAIDDLLKLEYRVTTGSDYYVENEDGTFSKITDANLTTSKEWVEENSIPLKVTGVIRPKEGVSVTSINGNIAYRSDLAEELSNRAQKSKIAQAITKEVSLNPFTGKVDGSNDNEVLKKELGIIEESLPANISIYAHSFETKNNIVEYIEKYNQDIQDWNNKVAEIITWNKEHPEEEPKDVPDLKTGIKYSDNLSMIMGYVDTLTQTITQVLVGFAAISLVVSSIMIAIIIYTSVLERRKEIGVLRSVGARKKDISTVFISESGLIGLLSGIIGIAVTYALCAIANVILNLLVGVSDLAQIQWWSPILMLLISEILSILAGFIPARIASNKDPVECLRSE